MEPMTEKAPKFAYNMPPDVVFIEDGETKCLRITKDCILVGVWGGGEHYISIKAFPVVS